VGVHRTGDEVERRAHAPFDNSIMEYVGTHRGRSGWRKSDAIITALGGVAVLSLVTLGVAGFF
jgi:hypothetical protein